MNDDKFLFSKKLREKMSHLGQMDVKEALGNPDFYIALMEHAGMNLEEMKALFTKVGRPDIAEILEEEGD